MRSAYLCTNGYIWDNAVEREKGDNVSPVAAQQQARPAVPGPGEPQDPAAATSAGLPLAARGPARESSEGQGSEPST